MDAGLARTSGATLATITLANVRFTICKPAMVEFFAQMEAFILSRKTSPEMFALRACSIAPVSCHDAIWAAAAAQANKADSRMATNAEIAAFSASPWLGAMLVWMCMHERHLKDFPDCENVVGKLYEDIMVNGKAHFEAQLLTVKQACGIHDLKNSAGRTAPPAPADQSKDAPNSADGQESTDDSPTNTDGAPNK